MAESSTSAPTLLEQLLEDYGDRNDAAMAAAEHHDASLWKTAHTGAVLDADLYQTRYEEVFAQPPGAIRRLTALRQLGTASDTYPRWVLGVFAPEPDPTSSPSAGSPTEPSPSASSPATSDQPAAGSDAEAVVSVFEQASEGAPWLKSQSVKTRHSDLPEESSGEAASLQQQQDATVVAQLLAGWLTTGDAPPWLNPGELAQVRAHEVDPGEFAKRYLRCSLFSDATPGTNLSDAVRVARAGSTSLIAASLKCTTTTVANRNSSVGYTGGMEKLYPGQPPGASVQSPWVAMVLLSHPDGATPAVIGYLIFDVL